VRRAAALALDDQRLGQKVNPLWFALRSHEVSGREAVADAKRGARLSSELDLAPRPVHILLRNFSHHYEVMRQFSITGLSGRESQIMEIVYRRGRATAAEVQEDLPDAPGYSSVRKLLHVLEVKGHLRHAEDGQRYVYSPTVPRHRARRSVLRQVVDTFFGGSAERAVSSLLQEDAGRMTDKELERILELARKARGQGR